MVAVWFFLLYPDSPDDLLFIALMFPHPPPLQEKQKPTLPSRERTPSSDAAARSMPFSRKCVVLLL